MTIGAGQSSDLFMVENFRVPPRTRTEGFGDIVQAERITVQIKKIYSGKVNARTAGEFSKINAVPENSV